MASPQGVLIKVPLYYVPEAQSLMHFLYQQYELGLAGFNRYLWS